MADKSVGELIAAQSVTPTDLFVLEQNGTAKKLTGQILENWLLSMADGHGGIRSIDKESTSGLVDTYRITLADNTTFDFLVTNGNGITSVAKTKTSGLVDTYTIQFNDNTKTTFTVTNGSKGDKGESQYVWIKYASQEPTEASHSFGDEPDNWIGIYSGSSDTAPTDWTQYKWFEIKGEKGNPGDAATVVESTVEYQASNSGTIIPSGQWSVSIPVVAQGKYLWTRLSVKFNSGDPVVSYSVARFGVDGTGSVSAVCNISPDETGNVPLTADKIGALPLAGGQMAGSIDMNGHRVTGLNAPSTETDAVPKSYVDALDWANSGTSIPKGADLDTYRTPGKYYVSSASNAGTIINSPIKNDNYVLYVIKRTDGASLQQIIVTLNSILYIRGCASDGKFRAWVRMASTSYVDAAFSDAQESIVRQVIEALGTPVFGTVDEDNNIILTGKLTSGIYTVMYEDENGERTTIGTISPENAAFTNVIPSSIGYDGSVFNNGSGYINGYRLTSEVGTAGPAMYIVEESGYFATGYFPYTLTDCKNKVPIYVKGVDLDTLGSGCRMSMYRDNKYTGYAETNKLSNTDTTGFTIEKLGDLYYRITPNENTYETGGQPDGWSTYNPTMARLSLPGSGSGVIVTVNEPIV